MTMTTEKSLLSIDQVAQRLGFCPNTVRSLVRMPPQESGGFPQPIRLGRLVRFRVADLEAWERDLVANSEPGE